MLVCQLSFRHFVEDILDYFLWIGKEKAEKRHNWKLKKTLLWAISKINSWADTLHSLCLPTLMSCRFPFPLAHTLPWITDISGHRVHEQTYRCTLDFFSHSHGCLGISQPQPGQQIIPSAQYSSLAVSLASLFVLCPTEYEFLPQQKSKLWWVLVCLCKRVFMAAVFKSQLLPLSASSVRVALWRHNRAQTLRLVFFPKPLFSIEK